MAVNKFKDEYFFLSNFSKSPLFINGIAFPTVEHYYQAMKSTSYEDYIAIANASTAKETKLLGRKIKIRDDWDSIKDSVMRYALYEKFKDNTLGDKLLATGDEELIEGNNWGDVYWGVDERTNKGLNTLGKMLMEVRDHLKRVREFNYRGPSTQEEYNPSTVSS